MGPVTTDSPVLFWIQCSFAECDVNLRIQDSDERRS